ncbi:MAG TPA: PAS domain S-box protein [Chthonomonadaceae bacterium]|nr:PAS domain S-box protein [Chthonomonadaceae bacterium]
MSKPLQTLIVEDNEDDLLLIVRALRQGGYTLETLRVESADAMWNALAQRKWDVVISDYSLPHFNALQALEILKESGQDIPFFIVSGTVTDEMAAAGMRAGAHDYLMKDNLARLGPAIERELQEAVNRREKRRSEAALRASEERFRATFDQVAIGIGHGSLAGQWLLVNPQLCALLGYMQSELLTLRFQDITYQDDLPYVREQFQRLMSGEIPNFTIENRVLRKDGALVWTNTTVSLVSQADGAPDYFIAAIEDISARKAVEAHIQALNRSLRDAMKETHHRVKNNLQIIASMVDMRLLESDSPVTLDDLRRISACVHTLAVIHEMLTERAKEDERADTVSAREMLGRLLPMLQRAVPIRGIRFELEDIPLPTRQSTALALITNELVSNALKHSQGSVDVSFRVQGEDAILEVHDDGPGFPPDFDPKLAANTGLELVESLTHLDLLGTSRYRNRPEGGASVEICLPLPAI